MTGARHSMYGPGPFKEYVKNGLICWWDGIDNAGPGLHSSNTGTWKNLGSLGSAYDATRSYRNTYWEDNAARFDASYCFLTPNYLMSSHMKGEWTVEAVFTPDSGWFRTYRGVFGDHSSAGKGLIGLQYGGSTIGNGVYQQGSGAGDKATMMLRSSAFSGGNIYHVSFVGSKTGVSFKIYINATEVTSSSPSYSSRTGPSSGDNLVLTSTHGFCIGSAMGSRASDSARNYSGKIHCVRVYNRAISEPEIVSNYKIDGRRFGGPTS